MSLVHARIEAMNQANIIGSPMAVVRTMVGFDVVEYSDKVAPSVIVEVVEPLKKRSIN